MAAEEFVLQINSWCADFEIFAFFQQIQLLSVLLQDWMTMTELSLIFVQIKCSGDKRTMDNICWMITWNNFFMLFVKCCGKLNWWVLGILFFFFWWLRGSLFLNRKLLFSSNINKWCETWAQTFLCYSILC